MSPQRLDEVSSWRSSPLTSKTMWSIYVSQFSLAAALWQYLATVQGRPATTVLLAFIGSIALVGITGVAGLAWADPAVAMARAIKGAPEGSTVRAESGPPEVRVAVDPPVPPVVG